MHIKNCLRIVAVFGVLATASIEAESVPGSWIEVCNGKNHNNECGKVDMSGAYLGKCSKWTGYGASIITVLTHELETIPNGVFYNRVMSVKFEGLPAGSCCELFE